MGLRIVASALAGLAAMIAAGTADAAVYVYTGNAFTTIGLQGPTTPADVYTTADRVTITLTLASPLAANLSGSDVAATAFSFSDGVNVISNTTATGFLVRFWTNSAGAIVNWNVSAFQLISPNFQKGISSQNYLNEVIGLLFVEDIGQDTLCGPSSTSGSCAFFGDPFYAQQGRAIDAPGVWALQADPDVIPLPAGAWLMLAGLAGLGGLSSRRKRAAT